MSDEQSGPVVDGSVSYQQHAATLRASWSPQIRAFADAFAAKLDAERRLRQLNEACDEADPLYAPHFSAARAALAEATERLATLGQ